MYLLMNRGIQIDRFMCFSSLKAQLVLTWSRQRKRHREENKSSVRLIEPVIKTKYYHLMSTKRLLQNHLRG